MRIIFFGDSITHGWLSDGLHPNEAGHTFIASRGKLELDKLLKEQK
jgi:lysophospholipase L1-like esterase